jgi:hypothetical protein
MTILVGETRAVRRIENFVFQSDYPSHRCFASFAGSRAPKVLNDGIVEFAERFVEI